MVTGDEDYQLYYSNPNAANPPADVNAIFLPVADANTVGLWHFQEGTGNTVHDSSGRGHNGNFVNAGWTSGLLGYAGRFNGIDAYVDVGNSSDFDLTAMTLEAWIYVTSVNYGHVISKWSNSGSSYLLRMTGDRKVQFMINGDGGNRDVVSSEPLELNRWYHVVGVHDGGSNMWVYVNGNERGHNGNSQTPFITSAALHIGRDPSWNDSAFPGYIQHMRVSNIARSDFPYARVVEIPSLEVGASIPQPVSGAPNLAMLSFLSYPNTSGGFVIQAVVCNEGDAPTTNGFYTDLYADHEPTGPNDLTGSIRFWIASPIDAGATVTLTTVLSDVTSVMGTSALSLAPLEEITVTLYSQADSEGVVTEPDDADNISPGVQVCIASADPYEDDDDLTEAQPIALEEIQSHNFDSPSDQDWLAFAAQGGVTYTIRTSDLGPAADTYLYVYDTDGNTLLAANDDYGGSLASQIEWTAPTTDTYYLLVKHWNPNVGGCSTKYDIEIVNSASIRSIYLPLVLKGYEAGAPTPTPSPTPIPTSTPTVGGYRLLPSTMASGGRDTGSANYRLYSSCGQVLTSSVVSSTNYRLSSGYWAVPTE